MRGILQVIVVVALTAMFAPPSYAFGPVKEFSDCTALNLQFTSGVVASRKLARLAVQSGYKRPEVNAKVALANDALSPELPFICPVLMNGDQPRVPSSESPEDDTAQQAPNADPPDQAESQSEAEAYYFEEKTSARRTVAYWPRSISEPQEVRVRVMAPGEFRGRITIGDEEGVSYRTNRNREWKKTLVPNEFGVINGIVSVWVSRDTRKRPAWKKDLPSGDVRCEIWINGVEVAVHTRPYKSVKSANCIVM